MHPDGGPPDPRVTSGPPALRDPGDRGDEPDPASTGATADVVVVGGGVAGLVAARELAIAGLRVVVLERGTTPGGAVARHRVAGLDLDAGAESFATRGGTVAALAAELGLGDLVTAPAPLGAWVQLPSGPATLPRAGLLGVPVDPWAPDVRRTLGTAGALRAGVDRLLPARAGTGGAATFGSLVRTRMGRRVVDRLVAPVVGGVHAADPDDLDVGTVAPGLLEALARHGSLAGAVASLRSLAPAGAAVNGLVGGMHTLVEALVSDLARRGGTVRTGVRVTGLGRSADGWTLTVAGPEGTRATRTLRGTAVLLATPAAPALGLLAPVLPALASVRTDPGADVVLVTLVVDAPELAAAPRGTGVLVARGAQGAGAGRVRAKALTHATAKWPWLAEQAGAGRHVLRLSYGRAGSRPGHRSGPDGAADPAVGDVDALAALDLDEVTRLAVRDAGTLLGARLDPAAVVGAARVRWSQSLPQPSATHRAAVDAVRAGIATVAGIEVVGAWVAGNGLAAVVAHARATARHLAAATTGGTAAAGTPATGDHRSRRAAAPRECS